MQHRGEKSRPIDFGHRVGDDGELRRTSTTSTGHAHGCPWFSGGRPEAPQHVWPSGHARVSSAPNGEGVSDAGDCHAGEWHKERGRVV